MAPAPPCAGRPGKVSGNGPTDGVGGKGETMRYHAISLAILTILAGADTATAQERARLQAQARVVFSSSPPPSAVPFEVRAPGRISGAAPVFCRTGEGHPVHGWRWCADRGWTRAHRWEAPASLWRSVRWNRSYFLIRFHARVVRYQGPHWDLWRMVDDRTYRRLVLHRNRLDLGGALTGVWVERGPGVAALQVQAGRIPIAELLDFEMDGRIDRVMLRRSAW